MNNNGTEFARDAASVAAVTDSSTPFCYTLSRVLLNSLLNKSVKGQEELQSSKLVLNFPAAIADRDREVHWMLIEGRKFRLGLSTLGCGIAILDRILRLVKVQAKYVHCVAVAALGLAVKFHEEVDPILEVYEANRETALLLGIPSPEPMSADDLAVKIRENSSYSPQELNRMERTLLARLQWDLLLPSFDRFLRAMLAVIGAPHLAASNLLHRNFELIISTGELVWTYSPSALALSLLSVMLEWSSLEWLRITESLRNIFQIDNVSLIKCRQETVEFLRERYCWNKPAAGIGATKCARFLRPSSNTSCLPSRKNVRKQRNKQAPLTAIKHRRPVFVAFIEHEVEMLDNDSNNDGAAEAAECSTMATTISGNS